MPEGSLDKGSTQETRSILELVDAITNKKLLLPEFQRDFRWPIEKTLTLFDSINRNLFIGSLILARPKFDLACKEFDLRERGSRRHKPKPKQYKQSKFDDEGIYTLLDGQQRATSIYRALLGKDDIYYVFQEFSKLKSVEFYDSTEEKKQENIGIEDYISNVDDRPPKDEILHVRVSDLYEYRDRREKNFIEDIIEPQLSDYSISSEEKEVAREFAGSLFADFLGKILMNYKLLSVQLLNMPLDKFCLFFERSNSKGMTLSFVDIINAKVYVDFKLSRAITKAKNEHSRFTDSLVDPLVRYINYIENREVTKTSILESLNGQHLNEHWETCARDIDYIQKWLEDSDWIYKVEELPYRSMLLPLLSFYQNIPNKEFTQVKQRHLDQLKFWFYASLIDSRYAGGGHGSTNVVIKNDCKALGELAKGTDISADFWSKFRLTFSFENLKRTDNEKSASFTGLLYYMWSKNKFKNFENDAVVSMSAKTDFHHVFPDKYLDDKFGVNSDEYDLVDSVLNKVKINKISNIKIGKKSPKTYLDEIRSSKNPNIEESLESHKIDFAKDLADGKYDSNYLQFLKLRFKCLEPTLKEITNTGERLAAGKYTDLWKA